ncbi:MAG TPA: hypothetical protein PKJ83_12875 [Cyclobacteriaceae bacterium]|nr:hypothetical protein [Cyclobacteriaceae bacterium]HPW61000.1 hypothetical protein [Cyclobacteriaceae bacterium]
MKNLRPKMIKSLYRISVLLIITAITTIFKSPTELEWYYMLIIVFASMNIGGMLYKLREGISSYNVHYLSSGSDHYSFIIAFQLGFSPFYYLMGSYDGENQYDKDQLSTIIYENSTRKLFLPLIKGRSDQIEVDYVILGKPIRIHFRFATNEEASLYNIDPRG